MSRTRGHPPEILRGMGLTLELWDELRARAGPFLFTLQGMSMWPAAPPGSVLSVEPCASTALRPGELMIFRTRHSIITHRVIHVLKDGRVFSWGDSLLAADGLVAPEDVLGRATLTSRATAYVGWRTGWLLVRRTSAGLVRLARGARARGSLP